MPKKVSFKNNKGQKIVGILNIPQGQPPFPAVIICHGFRGKKEAIPLRTIASQLAKSGFLAFRFDFTNGVGESYGKLEDISFSQSLKDLRSAINYLNKQKLVDKKRIGLVGHSLGGQIVLHYTPTDKRVKVLVDLAGVVLRGKGNSHLEKNVVSQLKEAKKSGFFWVQSKSTGKRYKIKISYYYDLIKHNTPAQIKRIKIPTLVIHGSKDKTVSLIHPRLAFKLLKQPKKLIIVKGAPHFWYRKGDAKFRAKINPLVVDWFKKYL